MSTPTRTPRPPAFTDDPRENPEDQYRDTLDATDDLISQVLKNKKDKHPKDKHLAPVPPLATPAETPATAGQDEQAPELLAVELSPLEAGDKPTNAKASPQAGEAPGAGGSIRNIEEAPSRKTKPAEPAKATRPQVKPPAPWVAYDVYSRLTEFSENEKRTKRSAARPFGVIVMDAIEHHADTLASTWKQSGSEIPQPGGLFVREKNSRYRRHAMPPRAITLQGMSPDNARLLKKLQKQWGAGSVSDLVEQALRLEFGM